MSGEAESVNVRGAAVSGAVAASGSPYEITVSDPVKQGEGMNAFVSYKVNTKTELKEYEFGQFSVIRRYSDFVWLHAQLVKANPGAIVPPLPGKMVVGRFSEDFVETRRRALQNFLVRVGAHPTLPSTEVFKTFLEANEDQLTATKKDTGKTKKGFWGWASKAASSVTSKFSGTPQRERNAADDQIDEIKEYISKLEPQMDTVHKHTAGLIKRNKDLANGLFEFALGFQLLGQSESDSLSNALSQLGNCADRLSVFTAEEAEKETLYFEEPIKFYTQMVDAVKAALSVRSDKEGAYEKVLSELSSKKSDAAKLEGVAGKEEKLAAVNAAIAEIQEKADEAKRVFDETTERVLNEVARFKKDKLRDFKKLVLDYVQMQIEYNQKVEEAWRAVLPDIESITEETAAAEASVASSLDNMGLSETASPPEPPARSDPAPEGPVGDEI